MHTGQDGDRRGWIPGPPAASATDGAAPAWLDEQWRDTRVPLHLDGGASAQEATRLRRAFTAWLVVDVGGEQFDDVVLAVYEALANAAEHAYADHPDGTGWMSLTAHRSVGDVLIVVADQGHWRATTGEPFRSRGLDLMRLLMRDVHVGAAPLGTAVHLRAAVPSAKNR